jgi:hypothetical protein
MKREMLVQRVCGVLRHLVVLRYIQTRLIFFATIHVHNALCVLMVSP